MKSKLITCACLFAFSLTIYAQTPSDGPPIEWMTIDWAPTESDGETPQTRTNSGEDWWYDVKPVFDANDDQIGYVTCGFTNWKKDMVFASGSCHPEKNYTIAKVGCDEFGTSAWWRGNSVATAAMYNLNGKMLWCKSYNPGAFFSVVQCPDQSGFVMVGQTLDTKDRTEELYDWNDNNNTTGFLAYNPISATNKLILDGDNCTYPPETGVNGTKFISATKIDNEGVAIWSYAYGAYDLGDLSNDDLIAQETNGKGLGIATWDNSGENNYRLVGSTNNTTNSRHAVFIDIDDDGFLLQKHELVSPYSDLDDAICVTRSSAGDFYVGGQFKTGTNDVSHGFVQKFTGTSTTADWTFLVNNSSDNSIGTSSANEVFAIEFDHTGGILVGAMTNSDKPAISGHKAAGQGKVYTLNTSGTQTRNIVDIGDIRAYDLKISVCPTSDNGFAVLSTKVAFPWSFSAFQTNILNYTHLVPPGYNEYDCDELDEPERLDQLLYDRWNSNAYLAKYTLSGSQWSKQWDKIIETPDARSGFPGDVKLQECVYKVIEADDGGLVVCGNTSHNFDDYYLFKIADDCELENTALEFPDEINSTDWTESTYDDTRFLLSGTGTVTINTNEKVKGLMVIPDGAKLVVDGATIEFGDGNKLGYPTGILVSRGGELELKNGAILKAATICDNTMWDGIQALGSPGVGTTTGVQARVAINSGCTIQDARIGVLAGGEYSKKYKWQGGAIVTATSATFLNNRRDVVFYPYDRSRSAPWFAESYLWHTDFITTGQLRDKQNAWTVIDCEDYPSGASEHVTIWDIHGIDIVGCEFSGTDNLDPLVWATGINSLNATYDVDCATSNASGCTSAANSFEKLSYGIKAAASLPLFAPHIRGNSFEDISNTGVYLKGISYADILDNDFTQDWGPAHIDGEVPLGFSCDKCNADARAIYLHNCNRYHVEANTMDGTVPLTGSYMGVGIEIYNTSPTLTNGVKNNIYKNTFTDLNFSSFGNGMNTGGTGISNSDGQFGLDQLCGVYEGNYYDILSTIGPGMSKRQGYASDDKSPAGNQFDGCDVSEGEIYVGNNSWHVTYVYHGTNNTSDIIIPASTCIENGNGYGQTTLSSAQGAEWNEANSCPSEFAHTSVRAFANDLMSSAESDFSTFQTTFNNTIDNGNQQLLLDMISNNDPENTIINTFDNDVSPYASDAVLISLMNDKPTAMSDAALVDILIDNSPVTSAVQWAFENRTPIVNATDTARFWSAQTSVTSTRKLMEIKLAHLDAAVRSAKDSYIRSLIFAYDDSLRLDTIIAELNEESDTGSMAELAAAYIIAGQTTNAQTTFAAFDDNPNWLDQAQLLSHHSVWFGDTANVDTLLADSAFRADILSWASDSSLVASMGSRVLLEFVFEHLDDDSIGQYIIEEISEYPAYTPAKRSISVSEDEESEIMDELNFTAYPNPFGSSIIFNVDNEMVEEIIITDIRGVLIDRIVMGENRQQIEWQAQVHAPGVYIAVAHGVAQSKALKIVKY